METILDVFFLKKNKDINTLEVIPEISIQTSEHMQPNVKNKSDRQEAVCRMLALKNI